MSRADRYSIDSWDDIQFVLAVARMGSFHLAGKELNTNQSTVSRRIRHLENHLGVKLFDRHAHGMTLTPAGTALVDRARDMESAARAIERHLAGDDKSMIGTVRVDSTDGLAMHWLTRTLLDFQQDNPEILLELITNSAPIDLLSREADVAIRHYEPSDPRIVAIKVGIQRFSAFASADYIEKHGMPATIEDFDGHAVLDHSAHNFVGGLEPWRRLTRRHPRIVLRVSTSGTYTASVNAGFGLGLLPNYYEFIMPNLRRVPIDMECATGIWLFSHEETNKNARVRATIDFLRKRFRKDGEKWFS